MSARFALLLVLGAVCAGGAALLHRHHHSSHHARSSGTHGAGTTTAETRTGGVLGSTTGATVTIPKRPTTTTPPLPPPTQTVPSTTQGPTGDIATESDAKARKELDAFLITRPALEPYEDAIWYSAHYSYSNVTPKGLAGLLWCTAYRIAACDRSKDAAAAQR